jgi:hypothetical protein
MSSVSSVVKFLKPFGILSTRPNGLSSDAISQTPYQSDFFSERQNFFETPSTRTRTSSSEGEVEGPESSVEGNEAEFEFIFRA